MKYILLSIAIIVLISLNIKSQETKVSFHNGYVSIITGYDTVTSPMNTPDLYIYKKLKDVTIISFQFVYVTTINNTDAHGNIDNPKEEEHIGWFCKARISNPNGRSTIEFFFINAIRETLIKSSDVISISTEGITSY